MSGSIQLVDENEIIFGKTGTFQAGTPLQNIIGYVARLIKKYNVPYEDVLCADPLNDKYGSLYFKIRRLSLAETPQLNFELFKLLAKHHVETIILEDRMFNINKLLTLCPAQMIAEHYKNFDNLIAYLEPIKFAKDVFPDILLFSMTKMLPEYVQLKVQVDQINKWGSKDESFDIIANIKCPLDGKKFLLYSYLRSAIVSADHKYAIPAASIQSIIDVLVKARDDAIDDTNFVSPDLTPFDKLANDQYVSGLAKATTAE